MKLEDYIRQEIDSLDETMPPEVNWHPEKSWKRINFALRGSGSGNLYFHYYLAAAVSFVLLFSGTVGLYYHPEFSQKVVSGLISSHNDIEQKQTVHTLETKSPSDVADHFGIKTVAFRDNSLRTRPFIANLAAKSVESPVMTIVPDIRVNQPTADSEVPRLSFSMQVGAGVIGGTFAPGSSFKTAIIIPRTASYHSFGAGLSAFGFMEKSETGGTSLNPALFVNAEFGKIKGPLRKWSNRSWEVGIGYLVANRSAILKNKTIRVYTRLPVTRHIKIAPELIFTDNLRSVLPGVTISLG